MLRARALEQAQARPTKEPANTSSTVSDRVEPAITGQSSQSSDETNEDALRVKSEIARILITMGAIVIIIVVVYFINQKTDLVLKAGKYLANLLSIKL